MFKYFLISIVVVPVLIGILAAKGRIGDADFTALRAGWFVYSSLWFSALYIMLHRWT